MKKHQALLAFILCFHQCLASAAPFTIDGKPVASQPGQQIKVPSDAVALAAAPAVPYELRFEALVPEVVDKAPDFNTPQIWFSVDYRGAQDQLAFALRGGRLQDAMAFDFQQRQWVGVVTEQMFDRANRALEFRFRRLPDRAAAPITAGKWVASSVRVLADRAELWVNDKYVMTVDRKHGNGSSVALGGSWQSNSFRNAELVPLSPEKVAAIKPSKLKLDQSDPVETEKRRQAQRASCHAVALPEAPVHGCTETSLDGDWLFMPDDAGNMKDAAASEHADSSWHVLPVPGFWNPIGWWCWGQSPRQISRAYLYEELERCEQFTFDWKQTSAGWYRKHLNVPSSYKGKRVTMEFAGVASLCDVYVNGAHAGGNMGMFKPFSVDLTPHLRPGEGNLVALRVENGELKKTKAEGKTSTAVTVTISQEMVTELPRGIYSNPQGEDGERVGKRQGGIWRPVRLRVGDDVRFTEVWPQTSGKSLKLRVAAEVPSATDAELQLQIKDASGKAVWGKNVPWSQLSASGELQFADLPVSMWSPESPNLYSLELDLVQNKKALDKRTLNIGFRDFAVRDGKFVLNGTPWRFLGANMPPHGIRPNDKELARKFVGFLRQGNQRALRGVCSPLPAEWLDEMDRQGVTVSYEGQWQWVLFQDKPIPDETALKVWKEEWIELVKANRHRPSILMWTLSNENYSLEDTDPERRQKKWDIWQDIVKATREADPTRPIVLWSGHTRANQVKNLEAVSGAKDDGEIDDRHCYTGTYTPSMLLDPASYWKKQLDNFKTPGRPFISQEGGTAYANTDVGHQELSYLQTWMGQVWTGRQSYPNASPTFYLSRTARITKEQLEIVRCQNVEGWLAFCNGTWYNNADRADLIQPFPVHESVRLALQPRLVALMRPPQRVFESSEVALQLYAINDAEKNLGSEWKTEVALVTPEGTPLSAPSVIAFDEPALGGGVRESKITLAVNPLNLKGRKDAIWRLIARDSAGRVISENRYEVGVFPSSAEPLGTIPALGSEGAIKEWLPRLEKLGIAIGGDLSAAALGIAVAPAKTDWTEILKQAEAGKRILVIDPRDLPESPIWGGAKLTNAGWGGEVAEFTEAGKKLGLGAGLNAEDMAWWQQGKRPELLVYQTALTFAGPYGNTVEPLVDHAPPHGYGGKWKMDFPVVRFQAGEGEIVICTLNVSTLDRDPAPHAVLRNLIRAMQQPAK